MPPDQNLKSQVLPVRRADLRAGAPGAMESLPTKLDRGTVAQIVMGLKDALASGMPTVGVDQLANKILFEGRADAGTNQFDFNNKDAAKLYLDMTLNKGLPELGARYAAAVTANQKVADKRGVPFEQAWNGLGVAKLGGGQTQSGAQHAARYDKASYAQASLLNTELVNMIQAGANGTLDIADKVLANKANITKSLPSQDDLTALLSVELAKSMGKEQSAKIMEALQASGVAGAALKSEITNKVLRNNGIAALPNEDMSSPKNLAGSAAVRSDAAIAVSHPSVQKILNSIASGVLDY